MIPTKLSSENADFSQFVTLVIDEAIPEITKITRNLIQSIFDKFKTDTTNHFSKLPIDIIDKVFEYLRPGDLCTVANVCKVFHAVTEKDRFIRLKFEHHFPSIHSQRFSIDAIRAVYKKTAETRHDIANYSKQLKNINFSNRVCACIFLLDGCIAVGLIGANATELKIKLNMWLHGTDRAETIRILELASKNMDEISRFRPRPHH